MSKNKSSVSKAQSYKEIGEYWDKHDIAEHWEETKPAEFEVDIKSEVTYYAVDNKLSAKVQEFARKHGVSPDTLLTPSSLPPPHAGAPSSSMTGRRR